MSVKSPSLNTVLGEETILGVLSPFIDYLETAISVYDRDGNLVGQRLTGNDYCRCIFEDAGSKCTDADRQAALVAVESGRQEVTNCCTGMMMAASPVISKGRVLGAVVGSVSEVPSDDDALREIAKCCDVSFERLREASSKCFHKPDYLYEAALHHLERLAQLLVTLYEAALEKETALAAAIEKEVALAATHELDERIFSSMSAGLAVLDRDLTVKLWNAAAGRITGVPATEATGRCLTEIMPLDMKLGFEQIVGEVIKTGETWQNNPDGRSPVHHAAGPPYLDITIRPLCGSGDAISGVVVLFEDITEKLKVKEERDRHVSEIEALNKVIAASSGSLDPVVLYKRASRALQEVTGARLAVIYTLDEKEQVLRMGGSSYEPADDDREHVATISLDDPLEKLLVESGKAVVVFDLETDQRVKPERKAIALNQGFKSFVAMPVTSRRKVLGAMMVFSDSAEICSEEKIRFIDLLSDQLGIAMQNSRLFGEVENSSRFMQNLLESMDEGAYTCDLERRFTYVNRGVESITGYRADELIGKNVTILIPEDEMPLLQEMSARRDAGETDRYEIDLLKKDGTRVSISQSVSPLFENGKQVGIVGVAEDITRRKQLRERLETQNQRLQLLQSITARSVSGLATGKALKTLVDEVAVTFGFCLCNIFMPSADGKKLQIVASHG